MPADEIFTVSQLVRAANWMILLQPIWEGLLNHSWNDQQLARLIDQCQDLDLLPAIDNIYLAEALILGCRLTPDLRRRLVEIMEPSDGQTPSPRSKQWLTTRLMMLYGPRGWYYQNSAHYLGQLLREAERYQSAKNSPALAEFTLAKLPTKTDRIPLYQFVSTESAVMATRRAIAKLVRAEAYRRLAIAACALERHRFATKSYPATLDSLAPRFLRQVPVDPMSGKSLNYQRLEDGSFRLYSVGPDGRDDSGYFERQPPVSARARGDSAQEENTEIPVGIDWVWPTQPAQ